MNTKTQEKGTKDLTNGSPFKLILEFAAPMLLGALFQQFYNLVDTMIVGKCLGEDPFAGVGSTGCLNFMIIGFVTGLCSGFAIPVAQRFGARDDKGLRKVVANCIWLSIMLAIIITAIVVGFCKPILRAMNTPENIFNYAYTYIVIIFAGIPGIILYNMTAGIIRSLGDSKTPVFFLAFSSIINIGLDLIFIVLLKMNVEGAALATVISQSISGIICTFYMKKKYSILKFEKGEMKPDMECMLQLCSIGLPMGLQYSITAIGTIVIQTAINGLGSVYVAAVTVAAKINLFIACPLDALGQSMAPYAGQNVGAGKIDRVGKGLKAAIIYGFIISVVMLGIVSLFGKFMVNIFLENPEPEIIKHANQWLLTSVSFYFLLTLVNTVRFTIQGMGYSIVAITAGVFEMVARMLAGMCLVPVVGFTGICFANPLAWIAADAFLVPTFIHLRNKLYRKELTYGSAEI